VKWRMTPTSPDAMTNHPLVAVGLSHAGRQRQENEDAFGCFADARLFIVADGMGGHNAGEVAAAMAIREMDRFFRSYHADPRQEWPYPVDRKVSLAANLLQVGIKVANDRIRAGASIDRTHARMGSTLVAMAIGETQLAVAHAGDSRSYLFRGGTLRRLTRDHSVAEEMRQARPEMTEEDLATFAHRNVVTRSLGSKDDVEPDVFVGLLETGDIYLLCSDGLWGSVKDDQIAAQLAAAASSDLNDVCQRLVDAANQAGGPDNITVLLVRVG
jgi:serine/threonine protein phosphatase PrpC